MKCGNLITLWLGRNDAGGFIQDHGYQFSQVTFTAIFQLDHRVYRHAFTKVGEDIAIETSVIIDGPGARLLTIDALDNNLIFFIDDGLPSNYANVEIYGVSLVNGMARTPTAYGGAIASEEHLFLGGVRIRG